MFSEGFLAGCAVFHKTDPQKSCLHTLQQLFQQRIQGLLRAVHCAIVSVL